jgi:transcriptional antiterminator RfaH
MSLVMTDVVLYPENLFTLESSPEETDRHWFAIYTKARQEKALARDLWGQEIPFYVPLVIKERAVGHRRLHSNVPLFPGYLFLFGTDQERVRSLTTNRVSRIIPVADEVRLRHDLGQLRQLIDSGAALTVERRIQPGQRVRIRSGTFQGVEGQVIERHGRTRLLVAVNFLQQGASIELDDFRVEPL